MGGQKSDVNHGVKKKKGLEKQKATRISSLCFNKQKKKKKKNESGLNGAGPNGGGKRNCGENPYLKNKQRGI